MALTAELHMPVWARGLNCLRSGCQTRSVSSGFLPLRNGATSRLMNSFMPKRCEPRVKPYAGDALVGFDRDENHRRDDFFLEQRH